MVMTHPQPAGVAVPSHKVYFNVQNSGIFLFKEWQISSIKDFMGVVVFICVLATIYEVIHAAVRLEEITKSKTRSRSINFALRLVPRSVLHILRVSLGYVLMMSVMTYNIWTLLAVSLAAGLGFFISRPIQGYLYYKSSTKKPSEPRQMARHGSPPQKPTKDCGNSIMPVDTSVCDYRKVMSVSEKELHAYEPLLKPTVKNSSHSIRETVL